MDTDFYSTVLQQVPVVIEHFHDGCVSLMLRAMAQCVGWLRQSAREGRGENGTGGKGGYETSNRCMSILCATCRYPRQRVNSCLTISFRSTMFPFPHTSPLTSTHSLTFFSFPSQDRHTRYNSARAAHRHALRSRKDRPPRTGSACLAVRREADLPTHRLHPLASCVCRSLP